MTFPRKKNKQKFHGYVTQVLHLIEQQYATGIPMTEIHLELCKEAGFTTSYSYFSNVLSVVRKTKKTNPSNISESNAAAPLSSEVTRPVPQKPAIAGFEWTAAKDKSTLDDIYNMKG